MRRRCEVLARDGRLPRVVRDEHGRVLRLHVDAPPAHAHWLGLLDGVAVWAEAVAGPEAATGPEGDAGDTGVALEVVWLDTVALDEVGVVVGPDRGDGLGLFDSPITAVTGEHTEGPPVGADRVGDQRRTAVLAWIAAQAADPDVPAAPVAPCQALKRLVADEPLDPLPALDGVPHRPEPRVPARPPAPEREDTVTQIEGFEAMLDRQGEATEAPTAEAATGAATGGAPLGGARGARALLVALGAIAIAWALYAAW